MPIVAVTGDVEGAQRERYQHSAINDVLLKPVDKKELSLAVRRWCGEQAVQPESPTQPAKRELATTDQVIDESVMKALADHLGTEKVAELVDLYVADLMDRVEKVRGALAARDLHAIQREAHDLRSTSGSLGLNRLFALGESIQSAALRGREHEAFALAATVAKVSEETVAALGRQPFKRR